MPSPSLSDFQRVVSTSDGQDFINGQLGNAPRIGLQALEGNDLILSHIPYKDPSGEEHFVSCCAYRPVYEALPGRLPVLLHAPTPPYEMKQTPGKGMGLFATRDIACGELIVVERPLVIAPGKFPQPVNKLWMEGLFQRIVNNLSEEDRELFRSLANCKGARLTPAMGIFATNGIGLNLKGGIEDYGAICPVISRVNHSCGPNSAWIFNSNSFSMFLQATRDIPSTMEITASYCELNLSRCERLYELSLKYHFQCTCPHCAHFSAESDATRRKLGEWSATNLTYEKWIRNRKRDPDALIKSSVTALVMIAKEGLESVFGFEHYAYLAASYGALADEQNMRKWGWQALLTCTAVKDFEHWANFLRDPQGCFGDWGMAVQQRTVV